METRSIGETKELTIKDCVFTLRIIPRRKYLRMGGKVNAVSIGLLDPDLIELRKNNSKIDDLENIPENEMKKLLSLNQDLEDAFWDLIKHGVCGHKGLKNKDGSEIQFKKDSDGFASDEMIELYHLNGFFLGLGPAVKKFNTTSEEDRKN